MQGNNRNKGNQAGMGYGQGMQAGMGYGRRAGLCRFNNAGMGQGMGQGRTPFVNQVGGDRNSLQQNDQTEMTDLSNRVNENRTLLDSLIAKIDDLLVKRS
jgi:hypothetical protein